MQRGERIWKIDVFVYCYLWWLYTPRKELYRDVYDDYVIMEYKKSGLNKKTIGSRLKLDDVWYNEYTSK